MAVWQIWLLLAIVLAALEVTGAHFIMLALEYLKTLPDVAKEGDRVFLPLESTQITGALGGIGDLLSGRAR